MKTQSHLGLLNRAYIQLIYPFSDPGLYRGLGQRLREWERIERLPADQLATEQWTRLLNLLKLAYTTTSFYRDRFDCVGIHPDTIKSPKDLQRILPLTRQDLCEHLDDIRSRNYEIADLQRAATGGTTDTPTPIFRSPTSVREKIASQMQFNIWAGNRPGNKIFFLWGARQDYNPNPSWRWRLFDTYIMRRFWAPTSLFNEEIFESYRQAINRFKPTIVYAYPTPLTLFCEYLRDSGKDVYHPKAAICTAEPLLADQRQLIQKVLGVELFEHYGSREFGMIAAECERHDGMHVNSGAVYIEYLPVEGAESDGLHEILVTDLLNDGMPLIRYRVNDCVLLGAQTCSCGRGYPLVRQVIGRTNDLFRLTNGDKIPGVSLTNRVLKVCPGLKKIQIVQETLADFYVRYVPGLSFSPDDLVRLRNNLGSFFPGDLNWRFEEVADIPRERSGKTRFCISRVREDALAVSHFSVA